MKLIVICAWCGKFLEFKDIPGEKPPSLPVSHGICPACKDKLYEEINNITGGDHEREYQASIG